MAEEKAKEKKKIELTVKTKNEELIALIRQAAKAGSGVIDDEDISTLSKLDIKERKHPNPGVTIIVGEPRSGKTSMSRCLKWPAQRISLDERKTAKGEKVYYGISGWISALSDMCTSKESTFIIDSFRLVIHDFGGPTLKGGLASEYKRFLTLLRNFALESGICIVAVIATDSDNVLDIKASIDHIVFCHDHKFLYQELDARYCGKADNMFDYEKLADEHLIDKSADYPKANLYSDYITKRILMGSDAAYEMCKKGYPAKRLEEYERNQMLNLDTIGIQEPSDKNYVLDLTSPAEEMITGSDEAFNDFMRKD